MEMSDCIKNLLGYDLAETYDYGLEELTHTHTQSHFFIIKST